MKLVIDIRSFNLFESDRQFQGAINCFFENNRHFDKAKQLLFNPLDEELSETLVDLARTIGGCQYYDENQFIRMSEGFLGKNGTELSLLCLNINGLPNKKDEFELLQETLNLKFDIIVLGSDLFLKDRITLSLLERLATPSFQSSSQRKDSADLLFAVISLSPLIRREMPRGGS